MFLETNDLSFNSLSLSFFTALQGVPCTWSYEMQSIFHNNFRGEIEAEAVPDSVLQKAITLHPIKRPQQMYLMHKVFLQVKAAELRHQLLELDRDAALMLKLQGSTNLDDWQKIA